LTGKNPLEQPPRMRFAPSPTGSLHVSGARTLHCTTGWWPKRTTRSTQFGCGVLCSGRCTMWRARLNV
jgi:hypothetical protein